MLSLLLLLFVCTVSVRAAVGTAQPAPVQDHPEGMLRERFGTRLDRAGDGIAGIVDALLPVSRSTVEGRKKKKHKMNKYLLPLLIGFMLIKSILLPIALKTLAILSGKAVVLSMMSLVLAAIVGLKRVAQTSSGGGHEYGTSKYRRQDPLDFDDAVDNEPYKYYKERRRKK